MEANPPFPDAIRRIDRELRLCVVAGRGLPLAETRSAVAISDVCTAYRRVRSDIDACYPWLHAHARDFVLLLQLLVQIADAACRVPGSQGRS